MDFIVRDFNSVLSQKVFKGKAIILIGPRQVGKTTMLDAVIGNFSSIESRTDIGALWENYLVSERIKSQLYLPAIISRYFWRTAQQQEIDYLEESDGRIKAFEFKWSSSKNIKAS